MINWFKDLFYVIKYYKSDKKVIKDRLNEIETMARNAFSISVDARNFIKDKTEISADIHLRGHNRNQIIVVGRYKKRDYVKVFTLNDNDIHNIINQLRDMEKYGVVERIDAMPGIKAFIDNELGKY